MTKQLVITETEEVEYITSALSVYIDYLTEKYKDEPKGDALMEGPWIDSLDETCTHERTTQAPPEALDIIFADKPEDRPTAAILCMNQDCLARKHIVDAMDAVRETVRGAIEFRKRIVKEWGYDPTFES